VTTRDNVPEPTETAVAAHAITALQADFPDHEIWREDDGGQIRYIARGRHPHTVVTADLGELRAALSKASAQSPATPNRTASAAASRFDPDVAHPARVYNVWLGGKDHFPADRMAAAEVARCRPQVAAGAQANRSFLARVVRHLAGPRSIRQFLDIGTGLPVPDSTHEVAQAIASESRVVYVDNDPLVLAHARALLTSAPGGACDYIDADLRDPDVILRQAAETLDFAQPAAVLLVAVLPFLSDADDPAGIVASLATALAPGSFLAISHLTADFAPAQVTSGVAAYNALVPADIAPRSHTQVTALFGGLSLVPPGVVPMSEWRPDPGVRFGQAADLYAGLATIVRTR